MAIPQHDQITVVSLPNLYKRPEALARYYVTSYWQAKWVEKLRWKTIELPSRSPPLRSCSSQAATWQVKNILMDDFD